MRRRRFLKTAAGLFVPAIVRGQAFDFKDLAFLGSGGAGCSSSIASDWATRVVTNSGTAPDASTVAAMCTFANGLVSNGLSSSAIMVNALALPNAGAGGGSSGTMNCMLTPLIKTAGSDPWVETGLIQATPYSINGLQGDAANNSWIDTGFNASTALANDTAVSVVLYGYTANANQGIDFGYSRSDAKAFNFAMNIANGFSGVGPGTVVTMWQNSAQANFSNPSPGAGYYCWSLSGTSLTCYFANSGSAHAQLGTTKTISGARSSTGCVLANVVNESGTHFAASNNTYSFLGIWNTSLSSGQSSTLFNLIQALRQSLGGGYV